MNVLNLTKCYIEARNGHTLSVSWRGLLHHILNRWNNLKMYISRIEQLKKLWLYSLSQIVLGQRKIPLPKIVSKLVIYLWSIDNDFYLQIKTFYHNIWSQFQVKRFEMSKIQPKEKKEVKDVDLLKWDPINRFKNVYSTYLLIFTVVIVMGLIGTKQTNLSSKTSRSLHLVLGGIDLAHNSRRNSRLIFRSSSNQSRNLQEISSNRIHVQ